MVLPFFSILHLHRNADVLAHGGHHKRSQIFPLVEMCCIYLIRDFANPILKIIFGKCGLWKCDKFTICPDLKANIAPGIFLHPDHFLMAGRRIFQTAHRSICL